jgi:hypothetical protein
MTPRNLFKLAVRLLGLVFLYHGLSSVPALFPGFFGGAGQAIGYFFMIGWPLLVGFGFLGFASKFTDFFYPKSED